MKTSMVKKLLAFILVLGIPGSAFAYDMLPSSATNSIQNAQLGQLDNTASYQASTNNLAYDTGTIPNYENNFLGNQNSSYSNTSTNTSTTTQTSTESSSFATGRPEIELIGASNISWMGMADITVAFRSATAEFSNDRKPMVYIEYTNVSTDETRVTSYNYESAGERITTFTLYNLPRASKYSYRAVMKYQGNTYRTESKTFTTNGYSASTTTTTSTSSSSSNTSSTTTTAASTTTTSLIPKVVTNTTSKIESAIYTAGSNHANGVAIGITDTQARVSQGDIIDFTVQYQNTRTTSLQNAELVVALPEEYEFIRSKSDFEYDERLNTIVLPIGRIASGGAVKSVTFTARAIGDGDRDVKTTATLYYEGGKISASDRDAYHGGSKSVLGASVFGAGFFPQTFVGWLAIVLLIIIIIVAARRYTKPAPQIEVVQKTA